ncbi:hypothetical protein [Glutamicibacter uratoxydans]|uniref:hypothetical protein n=1 Tax=Glutamicibacter uratoxydans TaxID=43667 RepID=UPI003D6EB311
MNAWAITGSVVGLGIAGLDPLGALMVMPAVMAGVRRHVVMLFFTTAAFFTIATGVLLGESVQYVVSWLENLTVPVSVRLAVQIVTAAGLGWWAIYRWIHRKDPKQEKKSKTVLVGPMAMSLAGTFWGVSAVTDPSFLALAAIDSRIGNLLVSVALYLGWFVVSQAPLCAVVLALAAGRDSAPVRRSLALASV